MQRLILISVVISLTGCRSTQQYQGDRHAVFDAAIESVPNVIGGMRLTTSDREAGTFEGLLVDGFGNVYLRGQVRAESPADDTTTLVDVDCWESSLKTLFIPVDAKSPEKQLLQLIGERLMPLGEVRSAGQ